MSVQIVPQQEVYDLGFEVYIDTAKIRPNPDQPRKYFDKEALESLAESIRIGGQIQPGLVRQVSGEGEIEYHLIDGERRYRACTMIGRQFRAVVREVTDERQVFLKSAMANFGKEDHTPLKIAFALKRIKDEWDMTQVELAAHFGKSPGWAGQHLGLLKLSPRVHELMSPELPYKQRIKFWIAIMLATFSHQEQENLATTISEEELSDMEARALINRRGMTLESVADGGKRKIRSPHRDYNVLDNFIRKVGKDAETRLDLKSKRFREMFASRTNAERAKMLHDIKKCIHSLENIAECIAPN